MAKLPLQWQPYVHQLEAKLKEAEAQLEEYKDRALKAERIIKDMFKVK